MIEFVSYDGAYPCLCMGTPIIKIDGEIVELPKYCLMSGGHIENWEDCYKGPYGIIEGAIPEKYKHLANEILNVLNDNIPWGCCGGCI